MNGNEDINKVSAVSENTTFNAFSTTKTITSTAVLKLVQDGVIHLDDKVVEHLSEYSIPDQVKIKHLLSHQSGISNPIPLKWIHLKEEHKNFNPHDFTDNVLKTKAKFNRSPESKFSYSNLNYLLLGMLIEKVANQSYDQFVSENIFEPLIQEGQEMSFKHPEKNHATGYHKNNCFQRLLLKLLINKEGLFEKTDKNWLSLHPFYVNGTAYGGLFSHPKSMMKYCQSLMPGDETLLIDNMKKYIYEDNPNKDGQPTGMSLGWFMGNINKHNYICHAGGGVGYYTEIRIYPELRKGSVLMLNSSGMQDKRILDKIDEQLI